MESNQRTAPNFLHKRQGKDNDFKSQLKTIFQYLQKHVATASMVSAATGIPQKNICRFKRDLEKAGRLCEIEKKLCKKNRLQSVVLNHQPRIVPVYC